MKKNTIISICFCAFIILGVGALLFFQSHGTGEEAQTTQETTTIATTTTTTTVTTTTAKPVGQTFEGTFELPIDGSTGFASTNLSVYAALDKTGGTVTTLKAGQGFLILGETGAMFHIEVGGVQGYVESQYSMVNLPDIIPSIVYDNTNSYSSVLKSSYKNIPGVTGEALYDVNLMNNRYGEEMYVVPMLYPAAKKLMAAQSAALLDGNTIIVNEAFRPYDVQHHVVDGLDTLASMDSEVNAGISTSPWSKSWFISQNLSNHQLGVAMDVSLGKINTQDKGITGVYAYTIITDYTEYTMPTPIHELSIDSVKYNSPVSNKVKSNWQNAKFASGMTDGAIMLHNYCTNAGFAPLASEWWHFDDLDAKAIASKNSGSGKYSITENYSVEPQ